MPSRTRTVAQPTRDSRRRLRPRHAEVAAGRRALEAGRSEEALAQAEALLAGSPGHEAAAALKVEALLSLNQRQKALDAYDAWFKVSQRENLRRSRP